MVNIINTSVNNCSYATRNSSLKNNQNSVFKTKENVKDQEEIKNNKYVDVQETYDMLKNNNLDLRITEDISSDNTQEDETENNNISKQKKLETYYQGIPLEQWALTDPKYTDPETGISWYVRDGKYPYMIGEDSEKFQKLCEESGEFALKKFAEMTGLIQQLDDNTVAYIGDNGIGIKSVDGREMFIDTSGLSYDIIMNMFNNLSPNGDVFSNEF